MTRIDKCKDSIKKHLKEVRSWASRIEEDVDKGDIVGAIAIDSLFENATTAVYLLGTLNGFYLSHDDDK